MPLVWAHAEYLKLCRSLQDGRIFDLPPQGVQRYLEQRTPSRYAIWRFSHKCRSIPAGKILRVEVRAPATVHWSSDGWHTTRDTKTRDTQCGLHIADLPTEQLSRSERIEFTFYWVEANRWEGADFELRVDG